MKYLLPALVWLAGAIYVASAGTTPDPYQALVRGLGPSPPYPVAAVTVSVVLLSAHAAIVLAIIRPRTYRHSWLRALAALAFSLAFSAWTLLSSMHAPPHFFAFVMWQLVCSALLILLLLWSSICAYRSRHGA